MPNNYLSVLYKNIIQVENKNVGLKVCVCVCGGGGGAQTYHCPPPPPITTPVIYMFVIFTSYNLIVLIITALHFKRNGS